ncbi:MAG: hypothetical protein HOP30_18225 [Cyclobacteriaceae bacterium]|nr:hypothetical protein [Cyclobacteriaceae bacterium]
MKIFMLIIALFGIFIIVSVFLFFYRIGKPVNLAASDSYYHHAWKNKIIYSPMGNWFELGYTITDADPTTFTVLNREFGKDKEAIFWKGIKQSVDYATFVIDDDGIAKDVNHVYYFRSFGGELTVVAGADPKTYQPDSLPNETSGQKWHRDHQSVFLYGKRIDADGKTFSRINETLAYDSLSLYSIVTNYQSGSGTAEDHTHVIRLNQKPTDTPIAINRNYARMGNAVLLSNWKTDFVMLSFDAIDTIQVVDERNIIVNTQLVSDGKLMSAVDVNSLQIIDRDFMKDQNAVYYEKELIANADATSFEVVSEFYSKDKQHVFYKNILLPNVNPKSFTIDYGSNIATDGKISFKDGVVVNP